MIISPVTGSTTGDVMPFLFGPAVAGFTDLPQITSSSDSCTQLVICRLLLVLRATAIELGST